MKDVRENYKRCWKIDCSRVFNLGAQGKGREVQCRRAGGTRQGAECLEMGGQWGNAKWGMGNAEGTMRNAQGTMGNNECLMHYGQVEQGMAGGCGTGILRENG